MTVIQSAGSAVVQRHPIHDLDQSLIDLLPAAVYVCDRDGLILRYNRKAAEFWGRAPRCGDTEQRFCGAHRLFWPDGRLLPHDQTPMAAALSDGVSTRDQEVVIEQPTGKRVYASVNIDPIRDESGQILGAVNCFVDIGARKQVEAQAKEAQALLQSIVETTPECIKIVARDGTLLHMNPAGLRMIEHQRAADAIGGCTFDLIAAEDRAKWREQHERVCNGERLSWQFDIVGANGTRRRVETHAAPLKMPDGSIVQLAVTRDITEQARYEKELEHRERHFRELLEGLPAAVYTTDAAGRVTFYNQAAAELAGRRPEIGKDDLCITWRLYHPDGTPMPLDESPMAIALKENRPVRGAEALAERPDGSRVSIIPYPTPMRDASGKLIGAVNMLVDISDRKQAEQRQQLLINELNHRVKNTLASVQSIAAQTFRNDTGSEAHKWFEGRLMALSNAHNLLTQQNWEGAELRDIVEQAVAPMRGKEQNRIHANGPGLRLPPKMSLALAIALHELCTNAAKYGALSNSTGHVSIGWTTPESGHGKSLRLEWVETGGPPVKAPTQAGFGSRFIERGLALELGAEVDLAYPLEGVRCRIDAPLH